MPDLAHETTEALRDRLAEILHDLRALEQQEARLDQEAAWLVEELARREGAAEEATP